jgi:hypothetical protein
MTEVRKAFSRSLYNKSDKTAKNIIREYLIKSQGHSLLDDVENYYADLQTSKKGKQYYHEAEMKYSWRGDWPTHWEEIRIPYRKKRLLEKYSNEDLTFYVISGDEQKFWKISSDTLRESPVREASNRYIDKGESFFHISVSNADLISINTD